MEKRCSTCGISKLFSEFYKNKTTKDGYSYECGECSRSRANEWASQNMDKIIQSKKIRRSDVRKSLLEAAQNRARLKNLEINITVDDIIVPDYCPVLKIKLEKAKGKASPNSPSLDRINPEMGYVKGNVQVISNKANAMKNNATSDELLLFAEWVFKQRKTEE